MTNSNDGEDKKVTIGEHIADTHRGKPVVGTVVTGDIVGGEVTKNDNTGDDTES